MTGAEVPAAAVQIVQQALNATRGFGNVQSGYAEAAVAALAREGWIADQIETDAEATLGELEEARLQIVALEAELAALRADD